MSIFLFWSLLGFRLLCWNKKENLVSIIWVLLHSSLDGDVSIMAKKE